MRRGRFARGRFYDALAGTNSIGNQGYNGPAPPPGHGRHHYYYVVHAVDAESLGIEKDATPALLGFNLFSHTLGRAMIVAWYEAPDS